MHDPHNWRKRVRALSDMDVHLQNTERLGAVPQQLELFPKEDVILDSRHSIFLQSPSACRASGLRVNLVMDEMDHLEATQKS